MADLGHGLVMLWRGDLQPLDLDRPQQVVQLGQALLGQVIQRNLEAAGIFKQATPSGPNAAFV